jgi:small GTP-binding protein
MFASGMRVGLLPTNQLLSDGDDPLNDGDQAECTDDPQRNGQHVRNSEPGKQSRDPRDDQPLSALGNADVGSGTDGFRPSLRIGGDLSGDKRQRRSRRDPGLVVEGSVERKPTEYSSVGDPVQRRVEEVAPRPRRARHACHRAVEEVAERQDGDDDHRGNEPSLRQADECDGDHGDRSAERHGIGRDVHPKEEAGRWIDRDADYSPRHGVVQHVIDRIGVGADPRRLSGAGLPGLRAWVEAAQMSRSVVPDVLRNVVLVGPAGSGRTTLLASLSAVAGQPSAPGANGLTISSVEWAGALITFIDTPGVAVDLDAVRSGLRGADAALFVVSSVAGIDAATAHFWEECEALGIPRAIVVTNLDNDRADFDETVHICRRIFVGGGAMLPLVLPLHADNGIVAGFVDLLSLRVWDWSSTTLSTRAAETEHRDLIDAARTELIEGIVTESDDERLVDQVIAGENVDAAVLRRDLDRSVERGHLHPIMGHARTDAHVGADLILDLIAGALPSPAQRPLPTVTAVDGSPVEPLSVDADGPLCAQVIATVADRESEDCVIVRVFSGTLRRDGHDVATAGRLVVTASPGAKVGDTLSDPAHPLSIEPWTP